MFNLDPTLTPVQQEAALVPSRYAVHVGDIDVLMISDGVLMIPTSTLATNVAPEDLATWLNEMFLPPDQFGWPLNVMLVKSGDRTILVDSGLGGEFPNFPRAGNLPQRLESSGIKLSDLTDIVITHMHMDHVGGLLVKGIKERLRPDVRIHVSKAEVDFWVTPDFSHTDMPSAVPPVLRSASKRFHDEYKSNLCIFDEEHEVAPGVIARKTGGHTPGHCVVYLESKGEQLMFAGDAIFPVGFEHPDWQNGFEHDPEESTRVRVRLLREMAETGSLMAATHIPFPSVCRVAIEGDIFRWVPVFWDF